MGLEVEQQGCAGDSGGGDSAGFACSEYASWILWGIIPIVHSKKGIVPFGS